MRRPSPIKRKTKKADIASYTYNTRQFVKNNTTSKDFSTQELNRKSGNRELIWQTY
jgi:hypothetical protein